MRKTVSIVVAIVYFMFGLMLSLVVKFVAYFAILSLTRYAYVLVRSQNFSFLWPSRGAFFLTMLHFSSYLLRVSSIEDVVENRLKRIPYKMFGTIGFILLITTLYRGVTCFFGKETFLLLDVRWIGDVSVSIFASLLICVWELVKAMCVSVKARLLKRNVELEQVVKPIPENESSDEPCEARPDQPPSLFDTIDSILPDNNRPQSDCYQQMPLFDDNESAAKE